MDHHHFKRKTSEEPGDEPTSKKIRYDLQTDFSIGIPPPYLDYFIRSLWLTRNSPEDRTYFLEHFIASYLDYAAAIDIEKGSNYPPDRRSDVLTTRSESIEQIFTDYALNQDDNTQTLKPLVDILYDQAVLLRPHFQESEPTNQDSEMAVDSEDGLADALEKSKVYRQLTMLSDLSPDQQEAVNDFADLFELDIPSLKFGPTSSDRDLQLLCIHYMNMARDSFGAKLDPSRSSPARVPTTRLESVRAAVSQCGGSVGLAPLLQVLIDMKSLTVPLPDEDSSPQSVGKTVVHDDVLKAWSLPYQGHAHEILLDNILMDDRSPVYCNTGVIIQSSGYGKSRCVAEIENLIVTIPINIRAPKDEQKYGAYPLCDHHFYELFCHFGHKKYSTCVLLFKLFLDILFTKIEEQFTNMVSSQPGINLQDTRAVAKAWRAWFAPIRTRVYEQVSVKFKEEAERKKALINLNPSATIEKLTNRLPLAQLSSATHGEARGALKILIYIDEAHTLVRDTSDAEGLVYDALTKALADCSTAPIFTLFLSTASRAGDLAPPASVAPSARKRSQDGLLAPYTEFPFDCHPTLVEKIKPNKLTLTDIRSLAFICMFGRPLFWALHQAAMDLSQPTKAANVLELAKLKLLRNENVYAASESKYARAAILDVLLSLQFLPHREATRRLTEDLVASHMRTVFSAPTNREYLRSGYPSEPLLAHAALDAVHEVDKRLPGDAMAQMFAGLDEGLEGAIDAGQRGEHIGKMLLLRAYMKAILQEHDGKSSHWHHGCSLATFLRHLITESAFQGLNAILPDNISDGMKLSDAFKNARVRFTHFARASDDAAMTTNMAWIAFIRGMAPIGWSSQMLVDVMIPILLDANAKISEAAVSALLVQFKRRAQEGVKSAYMIDEAKIGFFPPPKSHRYRTMCPELPEEKQAWDVRPYITIVMELGITGDKPSTEARTPHKVVEAMDNMQPPPSTSEGSSLLPQVQVTQVGRKSVRLAPTTVHPRYSIFIYGCTPAVYACMEANSEHQYAKLLQTRDVLADHPRKSSIEDVRKMKPFWSVGVPYSSWVDDPFLSGTYPHEARVGVECGPIDNEA
ncbi:hypothetical protein ONZ45_g3865 [Pleurotus djamor]|nr:hypothetical protein ONZ45_g3865 [Pleurotus djamor]